MTDANDNQNRRNDDRGNRRRDDRRRDDNPRNSGDDGLRESRVNAINSVASERWSTHLLHSACGYR